jgi:hypothetical protein
MRTRDKLAAAIRQAATEKRHEALAKKASDGYYDDFGGPLAPERKQSNGKCQTKDS